jgi:hypothetical protein
MEKLDCNDKSAELFIEVAGGQKHIAGEEIKISFWKSSDCINKAHDFEALWKACGDEYFLGAEILSAPLAVEI